MLLQGTCMYLIGLLLLFIAYLLSSDFTTNIRKVKNCLVPSQKFFLYVFIVYINTCGMKLVRRTLSKKFLNKFDSRKKLKMKQYT